MTNSRPDAPTTAAMRPRLSPGAEAVLGYAIEHGAITTAKANELLSRRLGVLRWPWGWWGLSYARKACLSLRADGLLRTGTEPDTWIPSPTLLSEANR